MPEQPLPTALAQLSQLLGRLPTVGKRSALRLAFHILKRPDAEAQELAEALGQLHAQVQLCELCGHLCEDTRCDLCLDPRRDQSMMCVVEGVVDLMAIEATGEYRGLYHVLGGVLSPLRGVGPANLKIAELSQRVAQGEVEEVILALPISVEGEATATYLAHQLSRVDGVRCSRIASGVPHGSELEYIDEATLARALQSRQPL